MTVTKDTVLAAGMQAAENALSDNHSEIVLCLYDSEFDIINKINDLIDDSGFRYEAYSVDYNHEAWDIVADSDFEPDEPQDFSGCSDAMECVLQEARASVQGVADEGWNDQVRAWAAALEDALAEIRKINTLNPDEDEITFKITNGSQFGYFPHEYETDYCNVWSGSNLVEHEIAAVETQGDSSEAVFYFSWTPYEQ